MSILICGASGLVGRDLCELFDRENIRYDGTYHTCKDSAFCERENMFRVDFTNTYEVSDFFTENKHRWLVCVFLVVERSLCDKEWNELMRINVDAVDMMSSLCAKEGIYFIHLSTDNVFDGSSPPYFPSSPVNPLQNYGITKLMSEYRVQQNYAPPVSLATCLSSSSAAAPNYCIIRTPVLYSSNQALSLYENEVTVLSKCIMDLRNAQGITTTKWEDDYSIRRPVYIPDLCIFIRVVATIAIETCDIRGGIARETPKFSGVYHFYNPDNCFTNYQMMKSFAEYMELPHQHIVQRRRPYPTSNGCVVDRQPYDTQLFDARYNIHNFFTHTFSETIPHIFSRFKHPKIGVSEGDSVKRPNTYFIMFDLDGTLVHTSYAHYRSYLDVFRNRGIPFMSYSDWNKYINYHSIHIYLENVAAELANQDLVQMERILSDIRNEKLAAFKIYAALYVTPTKNALDMLRFIEANPDTINAVVVTNSSSETTNIIREVFPELNKITKWSVRETYFQPKPHPESYAKATDMYYNQEKYVIGFENTNIGYESMRHLTPIVYLYIDEYDDYAKQDKWYHKKDAFIFDDYRCV